MNSKEQTTHKCRAARYLIRSLIVPLLAMVNGAALSAYDDITVTELEYDAWPRYCQAASFIRKPLNRVYPKYTKSEAQAAAHAGIWHFCSGLVKVRRAELSSSTSESLELAASGLKSITFSLRKIDPKSHPWASDMLFFKARAHRILKEEKEAMEALALITKYHQAYAPAYTMLARLRFDERDYPAAIEALESGIEAAGSEHGELHYFLGLAYFYNNEIEKAKAHAQMAQELNYPLPGLARKLAELEQARAADR